MGSENQSCHPKVNAMKLSVMDIAYDHLPIKCDVSQSKDQVMSVSHHSWHLSTS